MDGLIVLIPIRPSEVVVIIVPATPTLSFDVVVIPDTSKSESESSLS